MKGYRDNPSALQPAQDLFSSSSLPHFLHYLDLYSSLATSITSGKTVWGTKESHDVESRLASLTTSLPTLSSPHLTLDDVKLCRDWKMIRSRVRPSWSEIDKIDPQRCISSTTEAFRLLASAPSPASYHAAMKAMTDTSLPTNLHGVGPATASLLLTLISPAIPFFGEEAVRVACPHLGLSLKYSMAEYEDYFEAMSAKAAELDGQISPRDIEKALWAAVYCAEKDRYAAPSAPSASTKPPPKKKRKSS
jgi:hypothetical protein